MSKMLSLRSIQRRIYRINWIENKQLILMKIENNFLSIENTEKQQAMSFPIINGEIEECTSLFEITEQPVHKDENDNIIKVKDWVKISRPDYSRKTRKITETQQLITDGIAENQTNTIQISKGAGKTAEEQNSNEQDTGI